MRAAEVPSVRQPSQRGRSGFVFSIRLTEAERAEIAAAAARYDDGPPWWRRQMPLGRWIKGAALEKARWVKAGGRKGSRTTKGRSRKGTTQATSRRRRGK